MKQKQRELKRQIAELQEQNKDLNYLRWLKVKHLQPSNIPSEFTLLKLIGSLNGANCTVDFSLHFRFLSSSSRAFRLKPDWALWLLENVDDVHGLTTLQDCILTILDLNVL
jgi:hypothetical protein